jgi:hypothetical protein
MMFASRDSRVDGHQDLPSDSHEVAAKAVTKGDRIRWSSRRDICSERRFGALVPPGATSLTTLISAIPVRSPTPTWEDVIRG